MARKGGASPDPFGWTTDRRWKGVARPYKAEDVLRLRGSVRLEHTLARRGAEEMWRLIHTEEFVAALGALTGNQAVQQVRAGLKAIYVSGWQVAADANESGHMYPDQSLYPSNSVPAVVRRINRALLRADQIQTLRQGNGGRGEGISWLVPLVADAEAGFGGSLNAFEVMKDMIDAGAAAVHFEDQLASAKKCGHMGGKVLVPVGEFIQKLVAARLAADVEGVPTLVIARTDALSAKLLTSDVDRRDQPFLAGERTSEGFFRMKGGLACAIARGLAYAPYADMLWFETSEPNLEEADAFAKAIHRECPDKLLFYNCSPSFNWKLKLKEPVIARFQRELGAMGYKFQFVTLAGFHALNHAMFELAREYRARHMAAYADFQEREFQSEAHGYEATRHQEFVGTGYFDEVAQVISGGASSLLSLRDSTEAEQFRKGKPRR